MTGSCFADTTGGEDGIGSSWDRLVFLWAAADECEAEDGFLSCRAGGACWPCTDDDVRDDTDGFAGSDAAR